MQQPQPPGSPTCLPVTHPTPCPRSPSTQDNWCPGARLQLGVHVEQRPGWQPTAYTLIDNLQWIKGRHNFTFGAQVQWLETNAGSFGGFSKSRCALDYTAATSWCTRSSTGTAQCRLVSDGAAYASFLIGAAISGRSLTQSITDVGGRFRPDAALHPGRLALQPQAHPQPRPPLRLPAALPRGQEPHRLPQSHHDQSYRRHPRCAGVRWLPGYQTSPTSLQRRRLRPKRPLSTLALRPLHLPLHHSGPSLQPELRAAPWLRLRRTPTTFVFRGGLLGCNLTHGGGSGGGGSATSRAPETTANSARPPQVAQSGSTGDPRLLPESLLPSSPTSHPRTVGQPLRALGGNVRRSQPRTTLAAFPFWTVPGRHASTRCNPPATTTIRKRLRQRSSRMTTNCPARIGASILQRPVRSTIADPYYGGRGPQFINYNFCIQQMINKKAVLSITYAGSQTHFLPGGSGRGPANNNISPDYAQQYKGSASTTRRTAGFPATSLPTPGFRAPTPPSPSRSPPSPSSERSPTCGVPPATPTTTRFRSRSSSAPGITCPAS